MRVTLLFFLLAGCHLQPKSTSHKLRVVKMATQQECATIDRNAFGWSLTSVVAGAIGGAGSGITLSITDDVPKYSVGGASAGIGIFAAIGGFLGSYYAKQYTDRCTTNTGGTP